MKLYNESVDLWQDAKVSETSNISEKELYDKYQDAYEHYEKLHNLLSGAEETAAFLQHKAAQKDIVAKRSYYIGIAGFIVGLIGIATGIIGSVFF